MALHLSTCSTTWLVFYRRRWKRLSSSRSKKLPAYLGLLKERMMRPKNNFHIKKLIIPAVVMLAFWGLGTWGFVASGYVQPIIMFGYIGTSLGVGLGLYETLPKQKKPAGRRLTLFLIGFFLMGIAIFMTRENVQIEGAIFGLLTGVVQMGVTHYLIAKIFGPLLFGRMWCGWACWTVMILDLLPFKRPSVRLPRRFGWIRYLHVGI